MPVAAGAGNEIYINAFKDIVAPAVTRYDPDLVFLSAGFDAHCDDPLSGTTVTEEGFADMMQIVMDLADVLCESRLVSFLEGGYDLNALAQCVTEHIIMLTE